jgi:hypothetical protein
MTDRNYEAIIQQYIEKFNFLNNHVNDETYKWDAFAHFHEHWDPNVKDDEFPTMIKESFRKTSNLINNSMVLPAAGICQLAELEPAGVRELFHKLSQDDGGDIKLRQERIENFVEDVSFLMEKHIPKSWKFRQDFRVALFYLNLIYPDKNYIFKATEAKEFADRVSIAEDFGSGKNFSLASYYKMCDSLLSKIKEHDELMAVHETRWEIRKEWDDSVTLVNDDYHILVYDILYCAHGYGLYVDVPKLYCKKPKNVPEKKTQKSEVEVELEQKRLELLKIEAELRNLPITDLSGMLVSHKEFGDGTIVDQGDERISVEFSTGLKKFKLPEALTNGYLKTSDETERLISVKKKAEIQEALRLIKSEVLRIESRLKWM